MVTWCNQIKSLLNITPKDLNLNYQTQQRFFLANALDLHDHLAADTVIRWRSIKPRRSTDTRWLDPISS